MQVGQANVANRHSLAVAASHPKHSRLLARGEAAPTKPEPTQRMRTAFESLNDFKPKNLEEWNQKIARCEAFLEKYGKDKDVIRPVATLRSGCRAGGV